MLLVNHIVAHRQLGKALDSLALVIRLFPALFFFLLHAEHVALGDKDELDQRILESPVQVAVGNQNLTGLDLDSGFRPRGAAARLPGGSALAASRRSALAAFQRSALAASQRSALAASQRSALAASRYPALAASRRSALFLPHRRIRAEGFQIILPQVAGQSAGPGP